MIRLTVCIHNCAHLCACEGAASEQMLNAVFVFYFSVSIYIYNMWW